MIKGRLASVYSENGQKKDGSGEWSRTFFVITTDDQYAPNVCFSTSPKCADFIKTVPIGSLIDVDYNLKSREYNGKWFTEANAWKVNVEEQGTTAPAPSPAPSGMPNDLPF